MIPTGLTSAQVAERRQRLGWNELPGDCVRPAWEIAWRQVRSLMVLLLLAAAAGSLLAGDAADAIAIAAILVLNGVLGFLQDYRAERTLESLRRMAAPVCRVLRDGTEVALPSRELVPGDIVLLDEGVAVPADVRLREAAGLSTQEAALTGESDTVPKEPGQRAFAGTFVTRGHGIAEVIAIGGATELGRIAELTQRAVAEATPLEKRMDEAARRIAWIAVVLVLAIVLAGAARGEPWRAMFLLGVSMAVAAVPEGLPAVVTIALAAGSRRMLERNALVRRLASVETLGSVTVICTDKTGTLTENRMRVVQTLGPDLPTLVRCAALNTNVRRVDGAWQGDPTEVALVANLDKEALDREAPRLAELPFDSRRQRMTTIHATPPWLNLPEPLVAISKGAFEVILRDSRLAAGEREAWLSRGAALAGDGVRLLGVAIGGLAQLPASLDDAEHGLRFLGAIGLEDPVRAETPAAMAQCRLAGIRTVIITGDHRGTALAVAGKIWNDPSVALTGDELRGMTPEQFAGAVVSANVLARVTPEDKLRVVEAHLARGEVVAVTGDGVNDAPALKRSSVGVAMGQRGTDVARQAADIVLLDDNFATIVAAVAEGRRIYANIRKVLQYLLATNMTELAIMAYAPLLGMPLPLTPLQILWINLVTDGLPALALVMEPAEPGLMRRPPRPPREPLLSARDWALLLTLQSLAAFFILGLAWTVWHSGDGHWQSVLFQALALKQIFLAFSFRSEHLPVWRLGWGANTLLAFSLGLTVVLQFAVGYWDWPAAVLELRPLDARHWLQAVGVGLLPALLFELYKATLSRAERRRPAGA